MLQIYVLLRNPEQAGTGEILSIVASALTTGFTSAMIAFDSDVDVTKRENSPEFNGYIPDDHRMRERCMVLMTLISAIHNISRSLGSALLLLSSKEMLVCFAGGEIILFLLYKLARRDFFYWVLVEGKWAVVVAFFNRVIVKVIVDFSGCLHFR